jgi:hypothetical protein
LHPQRVRSGVIGSDYRIDRADRYALTDTTFHAFLSHDFYDGLLLFSRLSNGVCGTIIYAFATIDAQIGIDLQSVSALINLSVNG